MSVSSEIKQQDAPLSFNEEEILFLLEAKLARLATASADGQPHVVPIVYEFDGRYLYFSGWNLARSLKYRHIQQNNKVALVVDDLPSRGPWSARGLEIRGLAEILENNGSPYIRITPVKRVSWGLS